MIFYHISIQNKFIAEVLTRLFGCSVAVLSSSRASDAKESGSSSLKENTSLSSDALPSGMGNGFKCVADMASLIRIEVEEGEGDFHFFFFFG